MQNLEYLYKRIQSWYPDEQLTDYELNEIATNLVAFFTLGAKIAYRNRKEQKKAQKSS